MSDLLTKQQVCDLLQISKRTFETYAKEHELPVIELSSHRKYVLTSDLDEWINCRKQVLKTK